MSFAETICALILNMLTNVNQVRMSRKRIGPLCLRKTAWRNVTRDGDVSEVNSVFRFLLYGAKSWLTSRWAEMTSVSSNDQLPAVLIPGYVGVLTQLNVVIVVAGANSVIVHGDPHRLGCVQVLTLFARRKRPSAPRKIWAWFNSSDLYMALRNTHVKVERISGVQRNSLADRPRKLRFVKNLWGLVAICGRFLFSWKTIHLI